MTPRNDLKRDGLFPTTLEASTRRAARASLVQRAFGALVAVGQAIASWPQRRRLYDDLRRLSDRELADIGLSRGEIARVFEPGFVPQRPASAPRMAGRAIGAAKPMPSARAA